MTLSTNLIVLDYIASYLNTYSLVACVQVNHLWNYIFTPHLWRDIDDSQKPWARIIHQFKDPPPNPLRYYRVQDCAQTHACTSIERVPQQVLDLFVKYGHHIRRMVIHHPQTVELCLRARAILLEREQRQREAELSLAGLSLSLNEKEKETTASNDFLLPCENFKVLRFCFTESVLSLLKKLDCSDPRLYWRLKPFSETLCGYQRELEPYLTSVNPNVFQKEHNADDNKLHLVTLARSCWQLVINNRYLQELDMGPFGTHEEAFVPWGGFLKETLASLPMLRAVRVGANETASFFISLPTMLPRLRMLWYRDLTIGALNQLLDAIKKDRMGTEAQPDVRISDEIEDSVVKLTERMPKLRLLDIVSTIRPRHLEAIFACFPDLVTLSLGTIYLKETIHSNTGAVNKNKTTRVSSRPRPFTGTFLQELHVVHWKCPASSFDLKCTDIRFNSLTRLFLQSIQGGYRNLLDLLRLFPTLQDFQLRKVCLPHINIPDPDYSREEPIFNLKFIRLGKEASSSDKNVNGLLRLLPNLIEVTLGAAYPSTAPTIAHHCPYLKMIELVAEFGVREHLDLDLILTSCTKLKSLIAPQCEISYQKLMQLPLVCEDLQVLDCVISRLPGIYNGEYVRSIRQQYNQDLFLGPCIGIPTLLMDDTKATNKELQQFDIETYTNAQEKLFPLFEKMTRETALDQVVPGPSGSYLRFVWTCSEQSRPKSMLGRSLKATSRVLSHSQVRWTGFS